MAGNDPPRPDDGGEPLCRRDADDPHLQELVSYFLAELERRVESLQQAWEQRDLEMLRKLAHELHGAAGLCGFPDVSGHAGRVESALADEAEITELGEQVESLIELCRRACCTTAPPGTGGVDPSGAD